jgi:Putative transposase
MVLIDTVACRWGEFGSTLLSKCRSLIIAGAVDRHYAGLRAAISLRSEAEETVDAVVPECCGRILLPVRVLSRLFRGLFLDHLQKACSAAKLKFVTTLQHLNERSAFLHYLAPVRAAEWVVYAKRPFAGPRQVLDYVGGYTHSIAISSNRLVFLDDNKVRFRWKDYRSRNSDGTMTLSADIPGFCSTYRQLASSVSAATASSAIAIETRNWRVAVSSWACQPTQPRRASDPMITAITTRLSWEPPSKNALSADVVWG